MNKTLTLVAVLVAAFMAAAVTASVIPASLKAVASSDLYADLRSLRSATDKVDVIVHLKQQVNIQGVVRSVDAKIANAMSGVKMSARERSDFVARDLVHELRMTAGLTQRPLLDFLKESQSAGVLSADNIRPLWIINAIAVNGAPVSLLGDLAARFADQIDSIERNEVVSIIPPVENTGRPSPARRHGQDLIEENLEYIQATDMWQLGYTGEGVVISVVDTGVDCDHPALKEKYRGRNGDHDYNWWDPYRKSKQCKDSQSHGTHCTGIVLGSTGNSHTDQHFYGVAPRAEFTACLGLNGGSGTIDALVSCWQFVLAPTDVNGKNPDPSRRPHITSNSWGGTYTSAKDAYKRASDAIRAAGIFNAVAGGNSGQQGCATLGAPGVFTGLSTIAAIDHRNGNVTYFSSRGPVPAVLGSYVKPDLSAPGMNILSPIPGGQYASYSGTSMATPHVAGAVALLWEAVPELVRDVETTEMILRLSSLPKIDGQCNPPQPIPNYVYGHGNVKILEAFKMAKNLKGRN